MKRYKPIYNEQTASTRIEVLKELGQVQTMFQLKEMVSGMLGQITSVQK